MPYAKMSTKGQVVVPKEVREYLGIHAGDRIDFVVREDGQVVLRPAVQDVRDLRGLLHKKGRPAVTVEEMKRAVRDRAKGR